MPEAEPFRKTAEDPPGHRSSRMMIDCWAVKLDRSRETQNNIGPCIGGLRAPEPYFGTYAVYARRERSSWQTSQLSPTPSNLPA